MACHDNKVKILRNGLPIKLDKACSGESHLFTTTTTLPNPTYQWTLDSVFPVAPILSTESFYNYKFDSKEHRLYCVVKGVECAIQTDVRVIGKTCTPCITKCASEVAFVPSDEITSLIDTNGVVYPIPGNQYFQCQGNSKANQDTAAAILDMIKFQKPCLGNIEVKVEAVLGNFCIKLTIKHSPIIFRWAVFGTDKYPFQTNNC